MANRLTSIDSITLQRPDDERAKLAANLADVSTVEGAALSDTIDAATEGTFVHFGPDDPSPDLPSGTECVWFQTDGSGNVVDILSGVSA